jgi:hypothetical protein
MASVTHEGLELDAILVTHDPAITSAASAQATASKSPGKPVFAAHMNTL